MAVRDINEAKSAEKKTVKKYHIVLVFIAVLLCASVISTCITNFAQAYDYKSEAAEVEEVASSVSQDSADISQTLKAENHQAYFEKIAREEYGYCKPGEKVYYNSSYGD